MSQVAGHGINVLKGLPPLVIGESDVDWLAEALGDVLVKAQKLSRAALGFAERAVTRRG